jgi:hypothetical protein
LTCQVLNLKPQFASHNLSLVVQFNYLGYCFAELHLKLGDHLVTRGQDEKAFLIEVARSVNDHSVYKLFDACCTRIRELLEDGRINFDKQISTDPKYKMTKHATL